MLSVAFKKTLKPKREAYHRITDFRNKEELKGTGTKNIEWVDDIKKTIEREINEIVTQVHNLVDTNLLNGQEQDSSAQEDTVFYLKMRADYSRYRAEISSDSKHKEDAIEEA